jgi:hypothetical protein
MISIAQQPSSIKPSPGSATGIQHDIRIRRYALKVIELIDMVNNYYRTNLKLVAGWTLHNP